MCIVFLLQQNIVLTNSSYNFGKIMFMMFYHIISTVLRAESFKQLAACD